MSITIPKTHLSTPLVNGEIDIEKGFNLFTSGLLDNPLYRTFTVLKPVSRTCTVGPLRVRFDARIPGVAGIMGPGICVGIALEGTADGSTATFTASESKVGAGLAIGVVLTLIMSLSLERWTVNVRWTGKHWHKHLKVKTGWTDLAGINIDFPIDVSAIIIDYLLTKPEDKNQTQGSPKKLPQARFQTGSGFSMVDYDPGVVSTSSIGGLASHGSTTLKPTMWVMVNLADQMAPPAAMRSLHDFLVKWGGDFFLGPTLNLTVPTTVQLTAVSTDGVEYAVDSCSRGSISCSRKGTSSVGAGRLQAAFKHSAGLSFGLGIGLGLHIFKIFGFYTTTGPIVDFVALLGYRPQWTAEDTREAAYGAAFASAAPLREAVGARYEVILEEPAGIAV